MAQREVPRLGLSGRARGGAVTDTRFSAFHPSRGVGAVIASVVTEDGVPFHNTWAFTRREARTVRDKRQWRAFHMRRVERELRAAARKHEYGLR